MRVLGASRVGTVLTHPDPRLTSKNVPHKMRALAARSKRAAARRENRRGRKGKPRRPAAAAATRTVRAPSASRGGRLPIVTAEIADYLLAVTPPREAVVAEMEQYARARGFPAIGPLVGRLIFSVARLLGARRVFEMGSGFGYSAYWFARAVGRQGEVICTDGSAENARRGEEYMRRLGLGGRVRYEVGDAIEVLNRTAGPFDIVYIDVDKEGYPAALDAALPKLRAGGAILADNILWDGRVATGNQEPSTRGILEFTRRIYSAAELFTTVVPLRDGVSITIKMPPSGA